MPNSIAASVSVSRPCGANRRRDIQQSGVLWVIILVRIISSSGYSETADAALRMSTVER